MVEKTLTLGLFDPGMTSLHRVGLAGLYMTLRNLEAKKYSELGSWELESTRVHLHWKENPKALFEPLLKEAFGLSSEGAIQFAAHRAHPMGQAKRLLVSSAVLDSFFGLRGQTCKLGSEEAIAISFDDKQVTYKSRPVKSYQHQQVSQLFSTDGEFKAHVNLAGWALPGGGVRHVAFSADTTLVATPGRFLLLLFSPAAALFFLINRRSNDGKFQRSVAIVLPQITDLEKYAKSFSHYLDAPAKRLYASGLGDAGLLGLASLNLFSSDGMAEELSVDSCAVISFSTVSFAKKQKRRTAVAQLRRVDRGKLRQFDMALRLLENRVINKPDGGYWVATSPSRGLIAENIATGRPWFSDFWKLMCSGKLAKNLSFERKGLSEMVDKASWPKEEDKLFVEAVHNALRNRYGALSGRAKARNEAPQFKREFERIRTSLMRTKNRETLRAEIADLFARGGVNKVLQSNWDKVLGLFAGDDWQRARDLALLGLASYAGKGVKEIEEGEIDAEEDEA